MSHIRIMTAKDVPMIVRYVRVGEQYGMDGNLVATKSMVEFYDARHSHQDWMGFSGQFIARYNVETLLTYNLSDGLCLDGGVRIWDVDGDNMSKVRGWVRVQSDNEAATKEQE